MPPGCSHRPFEPSITCSASLLGNLKPDLCRGVVSVGFSGSPFEPSLDAPPDSRLLPSVSQRDTSNVHSIRGGRHGDVVGAARSAYSENESELSSKAESRSLGTLETLHAGKVFIAFGFPQNPDAFRRSHPTVLEEEVKE